jgi:hypothetical protein
MPSVLSDDLSLRLGASPESGADVAATRLDACREFPEEQPLLSARTVGNATSSVRLTSARAGGLTPADLPATPAAVSIRQATPLEAAAILHARGAVLKVLQNENSCSAWFRRADPSAADTFASLIYIVERTGRTQVIREVGYNGKWIEHGPYVASTFQGTGAGTLVKINSNGAFFQVQGILMNVPWENSTPRETNTLRTIHAGPFEGATLPAQMISLLHELAHVVGAIPVDGDSPKGMLRSEENTEKVARFCSAAVKDIARHPAGSLP